MFNNFVGRYLRQRSGCGRRYLSSVRQMMRGYHTLKGTNNLDLIVKIKEDLTNSFFDDTKCSYSKLIWGAGYDSSERIVRQYLLSRACSQNLTKALLVALGNGSKRLSYPLPGVWLRKIEQYGFTVNYFQSKLKWSWFLISYMVHGFFTMVKLFLQDFFKGNGAKKLDGQSYVYFDGMSISNLPSEGSNHERRNIVSWYGQWDGRDSSYNKIVHTHPCDDCNIDGIAVVGVTTPILPISGLPAIFNYFCWAVGAVLRCLADLFSGNWVNCLMLAEASRAKHFQLLEQDKVGNDYLFHNSLWLYRPLWTYEAERKGARILFYFYSTNSENFKSPEGYRIQPNSWQAMSWPKYLVWDRYQADFINRAVGDSACVEICGPIWFEDSGQLIEKKYQNKVCVFDVAPYRTSIYPAFGLDFEYYTSQTSIKFISDIQHILTQTCDQMVWKRKRKLGARIDKRYRNFARRVESESKVLVLDEDVSALRLIERSTMVISMAFTSTAIIASNLGKPSCYYDPTGLVQTDDRAAHGIEVISSITDLKNWVLKHRVLC